METTYYSEQKTERNTIDDFRALLSGEENKIPRRRNGNTSYTPIEGQTKYTRAEDHATFEDFIEMVNRMVTKSLARYNVEFSSDEGSRLKVQSTETLSNPHIQFSIKNRKSSLKCIRIINYIYDVLLIGIIIFAIIKIILFRTGIA